MSDARDNRLLKLEERMAYLEDGIESLGRELSEMFKELRMVQAQIKILAKRQEDSTSAVCPPSEEVPPPHY